MDPVPQAFQLGVTYKLVEGALDPAVCIIDEYIEQHWFQWD